MDQQKKRGGGSKSVKNPGAASRKLKRKRNLQKQEKRKNLHVFKSSHGKFSTVAEMVAYGLKGRSRAAAA